MSSFYLCLGLNNTSVHCTFVPTQTCVDPRPELDRIAPEISTGLVLAIRATGFRSLLISNHLSSQRYVCCTCIRTDGYSRCDCRHTKPTHRSICSCTQRDTSLATGTSNVPKHTALTRKTAYSTS